MKIKFFLICLLAITFYSGYAQKISLDKVTVAELEEKKHPIDSIADAAVLFNKARTFFKYDAKDGFSINTEQVFRIKIYKKEGLKWATYKVPYYVGYENFNDDIVEFKDCVTYNLENGKIVQTKLSSEGIFKTSVNKYWKEIAITMPNVKSGSIIEFRYVAKTENIVKFPSFNFQEDIPVNYAEYLTEIPGFFTYKAIKKGPLELKLDSKLARGSLTFANKNDAVMQSEAVTFQKVNNRYFAQNIPALKQEPFVDNIENYRLSIQHELEKEQFNDEPAKDYSMTWEGVAQNIYKDKNFGGELKERKYIEQDLRKILENIEDTNQRLDVIFKFVQNKMNWNKEKGYFADKGVKQAYADGTGNIAEINFILIDMLNYAGFKACPVLISTIDHGIPVYPNRTIFNYIVAAVEMDGKQVLLDAANKYTTQNVLPQYALNWKGRLMNEGGTSKEINLLPDLPSRKMVNMMVTIDEKGKLTGQYRVQRTDYEAFDFREKYSGINKQNYLDKIENDLAGIQISDYTIENLKDFSKPVIENFTFAADNQCEIIGDKIYINPQLFFAQTKNPFVQEKRDFPIYFGYPQQRKFVMNMDIPKGYAVESLPKPIKIETGGNIGSFVFNSSTSDNKIQVVIVDDMKNEKVSADLYNVLKDYFQQKISKQNEKIVLKKI